MSPAKSRIPRSYDVFESYVVIDKDGKKNGERILSRECFLHWLRTRKGSIVHPNDSFRRTLLSHLAGNYGRKPFEPEVEESLMLKLRRLTPDNKPINPWIDIFGVNTEDSHKVKKLKNTNRTSRYNSAFGFHEKRKAVPKKEASLQEPCEEICCYSPKAHKIRSDLGKRELEHSFSSTALALPYKIQKLEPQCPSFSDLLQISQEDLIHKLWIAEKHKVGVNPEAIGYLWSKLYGTDTRLSEHFVLPLPEDCFFLQSRPTAACTFNNHTWEGIWGDPNASATFGDIGALHVINLYDSQLEFLNTLKFLNPYLDTYKKAWFRCRLRMTTGNAATMLVFVERRGHLDHCVAQDQTDHWNERLHLSTRPFLL